MQSLYTLAMHKVVASTFDAVDLYVPHYYFVMFEKNFVSCAEFVAENLDIKKSLKNHLCDEIYRDCINNYVSTAIKINKFSKCKVYHRTFKLNPKKFLIRECVNSLLAQDISTTNLERYDKESAQIFMKHMERFAETNLDMKKINLKAIDGVMAACENFKKNYRFFEFSRGYDTLKLQVKTYATQYFCNDPWLFYMYKNYYCDMLMKNYWEKFNDDITLKKYLLSFASAALKEVERLPLPRKNYTYSLHDLYRFTTLDHPTIAASCKVASKDDTYKNYAFSKFQFGLYECLKSHTNCVLTDVILKAICKSCNCCAEQH
ncbi:orf58 [Artaxa digramma nucleopolyhedrovirus]|uniref:Orf58 n=1 Tax=Artaxa digramma nucleopolyhedrovirus TaxID=3070910 RepID=A0AAE6R615_9ABAC|nr:orf58 [Euproctis digramma nucleopolyhedrovirus]QHB21717.1 orf58 [Artaxa digramma nucleopolyhedrovirus]